MCVPAGIQCTVAFECGNDCKVCAAESEIRAEAFCNLEKFDKFYPHSCICPLEFKKRKDIILFRLHKNISVMLWRQTERKLRL